MIEILDGIGSLEIKGEGTKRMLILCDRLERWDMGIEGFKVKKGLIFDSKEQVIIIHTNVEKEKEGEKDYDIVRKAEFNSIKEVLDSLGIIIHWRV